MYPTATELPVRAYDHVNDSTKNAQQDAMLNPRFYTTDFAKIDALRIKPEHQQMWDDILAEFRRDPNKNHFKRNEEFDADFASMDPTLREQFIEFLVSSVTAESSTGLGFRLQAARNRNRQSGRCMIASESVEGAPAPYTEV